MSVKRRRARNLRLRVTPLLLALAPGFVASTANAQGGPQVASATISAKSGVTTSEITVHVTEPAYDPLQSLLDEEAHDALAAGNFPRAWHYFWRLRLIDPHDTRAMRECGRIAHAMGRFTYAVDTLGRVDALNGRVADPELHYLRGEALLALGRKREGERELARAELELGPAPAERRGVLWLARIAALRGDLPRALAFYEPLLALAHAPAAYAEVSVLVIEAHILSRDWGTAERLLRAFLLEQPDHARAREMLAWVLEAHGGVDESLRMRAVFADEWSEHPRKTVEYARALERAFDFPAALARYREADRLGVDEVSNDIGRLEKQLSPELGGRISVRQDPSGTIAGWAASASVPLAGAVRAAMTASRESTSGGIALEQRASAAASLMVMVRGRRGSRYGIGTTVGQSDLDTSVGGSALVHTSPARRYQLHVRGDANQPWRESSSTIREGGMYDAVGAQLYLTPRSRSLLFSIGGQVRRLGLDSGAGMDDLRAGQVFGFGGADLIVWNRPQRIARGEILDDEMVAPRVLASNAVVSYRHYEMASENPFGARLVLIERSAIDELSSVLRHVVDRDGVLGAELRGGLGYDRVRDVRLWRAGASLLLSATAASRLTLDYDVASETGTGLTGRRHGGSVVLHVDL